MFSRYFWIFAILAVFVAIANVNAEDSEVEDRSKSSILKQGAKLIGKAFAKAAGHCLKDAALNCESQFKHPKEFLKCGGDYLKNHPGCLLS